MRSERSGLAYDIPRPSGTENIDGIYAKSLQGADHLHRILEHATGNAPPDITLIATGSEVQLALAACGKLETQGTRTRVVSLPSWNLFVAQPTEYREAVFPLKVPMLAIEAGVSLGWRPYVGPGIAMIGVDRFDASAPGEVVMRE